MVSLVREEDESGNKKALAGIGAGFTWLTAERQANVNLYRSRCGRHIIHIEQMLTNMGIRLPPRAGFRQQSSAYASAACAAARRAIGTR